MIISIELIGVDGIPQRRETANVQRIADGARLAEFGLSLEEGKEMHRRLQKVLTQFRRRDAQASMPTGANAASILTYWRRCWSGLRISSSPAESAANSLVNACMNKKHQMRRSPIDAHRILQVRAAADAGLEIK